MSEYYLNLQTIQTEHHLSIIPNVCPVYEKDLKIRQASTGCLKAKEREVDK